MHKFQDLLDKPMKDKNFELLKKRRMPILSNGHPIASSIRHRIICQESVVIREHDNIRKLRNYDPIIVSNKFRRPCQYSGGRDHNISGMVSAAGILIFKFQQITSII
jgi:hypothetical protein